MNIWFYSFCTLEFLKLWFLFLFTMSERIKIGLGSSKKVPTEQNSTLVHLFLKSKSYRNQCIVSYFLCISIVSGTGIFVRFTIPRPPHIVTTSLCCPSALYPLSLYFNRSHHFLHVLLIVRGREDTADCAN